MTRFPLALGLLTLAACGGKTAENPDDPNDPTVVPTPAPDYAMTIDGRVTDANGQQARFAGVGTMAATVSVQAVTASGQIVATADVDAGVYTLGLETVPSDAFLFVQALDAGGDVLGSVVVELTASTSLSATPLDVESSVEAAVLEALLADQVAVGVWAEVRERIDVAVALAVAADADTALAVSNVATAIQASFEAHVDAWEEAGASVDDLNAASLAATAQLSAQLAAGQDSANELFAASMFDAATAQGLTAEAIAESNSIANAALHAALLATQASTAVAVETFRAALLAEAAGVEATINAQILAMQASGSLTATEVETAFTDLQTAIQGATTVEEIEAAVAAWRATVLGAVEDEITSQLDFLDQLLQTLTDALADIQTALQDLDTELDGVITDLIGTLDFDVDVLAGDIGAAFDDLQAAVEAEFADLDPEDAAVMTSVSLSFPGM